MINEKGFAEIVRNMRNRTSRMEREGDYWDEAEKEQLVHLFKGNIGITEIAVQLQRTEPAVFQQIEKKTLSANGKSRNLLSVYVVAVKWIKPPVLIIRLVWQVRRTCKCWRNMLMS